jgi:hypothetical protein
MFFQWHLRFVCLLTLASIGAFAQLWFSQNPI